MFDPEMVEIEMQARFEADPDDDICEDENCDSLGNPVYPINNEIQKLYIENDKGVCCLDKNRKAAASVGL